MSLEILKERFSVNHLTKDDIIPELEKEIENKENTILNLEENGNNGLKDFVTKNHQALIELKEDEFGITPVFIFVLNNSNICK